MATQGSLSFNSPSLGSVGTDRGSDNYGDTYRIVDFKISAPIARRRSHDRVTARSVVD